MAEVERLFARMPSGGVDQSFQHYVDRSGASEDARQQALRYVGGFHAADPSLISVQSLVRDSLAEEAIEGDHSFRFVKGYESLIEAVSNRLDRARCEVKLSSPVTEIAWRRGEVLARIHSQELHAPRAIITLPLAILKSNHVAFSPALPQKQNAMEFLEMGPSIRVTLCFREKFWQRESRMTDMGFLFTDDPDFPTWWTSNPLPYPIMTAWAAGPHAYRLRDIGADDIKDRAINSLARIMSLAQREVAGKVTAAFTHDWQADPFSLGAYSYAAVGGYDAARQLAAPLADTLYFAGEATNSDGYNATVHGAMATGYRAAKELLLSCGLQPQRTA